jgi:hypothetical protein
MKIKDLIQEIENCKKQYGDEFLEWNVYTEQLTEFDKSVKRGERTVKCINGELNQSDWGKFKDSEDWEYFECAGFWTKIPDKKIFTINVNY